MPKNDKNIPANTSAGASDQASPERVEEPRPATDGEVDKPRTYRAMNVSATRLKHDDGSSFPPGATREITEAELARFRQAEQTTGETFISLK